MTFGCHAGAKGFFDNDRGFGKISLEQQSVGNDADVRAKPDDFDFVRILLSQISGKLHRAESRLVKNHAVFYGQLFGYFPAFGALYAVHNGEIFSLG